MGDLTITFHLSETETAVTRSTFHRLSVENLNGAPSSTVYFVVHHMLQSLVIGRPQEDLRVNFATCVESGRFICQMIRIAFSSILLQNTI